MSPSQMQQQDLNASRSLGRWGIVASALIAMQVGLALVFLLPSVSDMFFSPLYGDTDDEIFTLLAIAVAVVVFYLGAATAFVLWMRRAAWNLRVLHPNAGFTFTPGWCVGWWFVPFANLWKPFQAMHEIWHYSDPDTEHVDVDTGYTRQVTWGKAAPPLLLAWWSSWVLMTLLDRLFSNAVAVPALVIIGVVSAAAALLCLLVIRNITAMQRESFARRAKGPDVTSALGHVVGLGE